MKGHVPQNLAESVRQRLLNLAQERGEDFQFVLARFVSERLLYRLSLSPHVEEFLLKGAMLFAVWKDEVHRPTRDLDLESRGERTPEHLEQVFRTLCAVEEASDGLRFDPASIRVHAMKELQRYPGFRVSLTAFLAAARIPLQVDIGYGDTIVPGPVQTEYPTLLDHPAPTLKVYPMESVVAEKFQAMVLLGMANTRMKDFYDLWVLARSFEFRGVDLSRAIRATFDRRQTLIPTMPPIALNPTFHADSSKGTAWNSFLKRSRLTKESISLSEVCDFLSGFLMPPSKAAESGATFDVLWSPSGPWR